MSQNYWLSVLFWFLSLPALIAQADSSLVYVQAKLLSASNSEEVPFAHIIQLSTEVGITSNTEGKFELFVAHDDSLLISSIGYENLKIAVKNLKKDSVLNLIKLTPKAYMLDEIMVTQYPSYEKLRDLVTNPILTEDEKDIFRVTDRMREVGFEEIVKEGKKGGLGSPISAIYNLFSRERKLEKLYAELQTEDKIKSKHHKRFNPDVVRKITGLTDSLQIQRFMNFCNFEDYLLDNASDYELYLEIINKFSGYQP